MSLFVADVVVMLMQRNAPSCVSHHYTMQAVSTSKVVITAILRIHN
ncbi:hypothetical protein QN379_11805 [Glaciimonas sp. Gout2]|nr:MULTISPECIES: hypothetical protein [unclassified Glaciimonas]MEB0013392.1 hypothetical protein [Glaciimonas sp. Cout2]MEB0082697.1 hypothetical protein [Glaciimonas sp. Gout2]